MNPAKTEATERPSTKGELDRLRALGTPAELADIVSGSSPRPSRWKANAHIHLPPNFSAFDSVEQAVGMAASQGVSVLGASNYYDFEMYAPFAAAGRRHGVFPIFGLEIIALIEDLQRAGILVNDPGNPGRIYICGKGIVHFAPMSPVAAKRMKQIRRDDSVRMRLTIERLEGIFAACGLRTGLSEASVIASIVRHYDVAPRQVCLQERHVAQAFQESLFTLVAPGERRQVLGRLFGLASDSDPTDSVRVQNEIRTHLMKVGKPAFVPETFVNFEQACRLILELGGIPCYPILADGATPICPYEDPPEKLVEVLKRNQIHCAEFIPVRNRPEVLERYVRAVREAGIIVLAGTEHNTPAMVPLEPLCAGGAPIPRNVREIFSEGACVVAAHQILSLHGQCGYLDAEGRPNPLFRSDQKRVDYFHSIGAAVIARYHEKTLQ